MSIDLDASESWHELRLSGGATKALLEIPSVRGQNHEMRTLKSIDFLHQGARCRAVAVATDVGISVRTLCGDKPVGRRTYRASWDVAMDLRSYFGFDVTEELLRVAIADVQIEIDATSVRLT